MSRLYLSGREIDFFNDIAREVLKDVVGAKIYYYPISLEKSNIHKVYEESTSKVFDNPIEIECMVDWQTPDITTTKYGQDNTSKITVFVQSRDLIDKNIEIQEGCFFSYGEELYEITKVRNMRNIYGIVEYDDGIEIAGVRTRKDIFSVKPIGPTREDFTDQDSIQTEFVQQRGIVPDDKRNLIDEGTIEPPDIIRPARVSRSGFVVE